MMRVQQFGGCLWGASFLSFSSAALSMLPTDPPAVPVKSFMVLYYSVYVGVIAVLAVCLPRKVRGPGVY